MIPKSGYRFSEKISSKQKEKRASLISEAGSDSSPAAQRHISTSTKNRRPTRLKRSGVAVTFGSPITQLIPLSNANTRYCAARSGTGRGRRLRQSRSERAPIPIGTRRRGAGLADGGLGLAVVSAAVGWMLAVRSSASIRKHKSGCRADDGADDPSTEAWSARNPDRPHRASGRSLPFEPWIIEIAKICLSHDGLPVDHYRKTAGRRHVPRDS